MKPTYDELVEALKDATAHLAGATSAYSNFAGNSKRAGVRDALYSTRLKDFTKATARARQTLMSVLNGKSEEDKHVFHVSPWSTRVLREAVRIGIENGSLTRFGEEADLNRLAAKLDKKLEQLK